MSMAGDAVYPKLTAGDLRELKSTLAQDLEGLIEYNELSVLVPGEVRDGAFNQATITGRPVWDFERRLIFLPLALPGRSGESGQVRAVAVFDQVKDLNRLSRRGRYLGRVARLSLEKFQLVQDLHLDSLTRLWGRTKFMDELTGILRSLSSPSARNKPSLENGSGKGWGVSLIMVGLKESGNRNLTGSRGFPRSLVTGVGSAVGRIGSLGSGSARLSEGVFAWLESDLSSKEALAKLRSWASELKNVTAYDNKPLSDHIFGGVASFPQDLGPEWADRGAAGAREAALELESLAGRIMTEAAARMGSDPFLSLAQVREFCGSVAEIMPLSRVIMDLGRREGVEEGMTFGVLPRDSGKGDEAAKAQLIVLIAGQTQSTAEIISQEDPGRPVRIGDRLRLLKEGTPVKLISDSRKKITLGSREIEVTIDKSTGLPSPMSARKIVRSVAESGEGFVVLMARIQGLVHQRAMIGQKEADLALGRLAVLGLETLEPLVVIRSGVDSLAFVIKGRADETGLEKGESLRLAAEGNLDLNLFIGVAGYPFLGKEPAETIDMAVKALDHASFPKAEPVVFFDAVSLNVSGDRFYNRGDLDSAAEEYRQALKVDPENINIINSLGACYGQMERLAEAVELFEKAVGLAPEDYMTWFNLGQVKQRLGSHEEALQDLQKAHEINPDDFAVRFALGRLYLTLGRYSRAAVMLEKAGRSPEASPGLYRWLGEALAGAGRAGEAIRAFKKAVKVNPDDAQSISWLGRLFLDQTNDREVALSLTRQAVELENDNGLFRSRLGWALLKNDRAEEALLQFKEALNLEERSGDVLLGLAKTLIALGRKEEAEKLLLETAGMGLQDQDAAAELDKLNRLSE